MNLDIQGKTALIGASSAGLGFATARILAEEGCRIVICGRDADRLEDARKAISKSTEAEILAIQTDLSQPEDVKRLADRALEKFSCVDILINNTGGPPRGDFNAFDETDWRKAADQVLWPCMALARDFIPGMQANAWGRIINITSVSVKQPIQGLMLSNALRAAVVGWAKTLSTELAETGILVNNVCPGIFLTDRTEPVVQAKMATGLTRDEAISEMVSRVPLNRTGRPEELAHAIAFLASAKSSFITGATLAVDGGITQGLM